jgi:hypothetical protein
MLQSRRTGVLVALVCVAASLPAGASDIPLRNWPVPGAASHGGTRTALADAANPGVFVPMAPCRVVDTRGPAGAFGGPILATGVTRTFNIPSGPCTGIPFFSGFFYSSPSAYSLNVTVTGSTNVPNGSFVSVWPAGGAQPLVSTLNFNSGQTIANAAIVPAGVNGGINVVVSGGTHLIIDINGYFADGVTYLNPEEYVGFWGSYGSGGMLEAENGSSSSGATTSAVHGYLTAAPNGAAVLGEHTLGSGANFGVRGNNSSTSPNSAGVLGVAGARVTNAALYAPVGVRGEAASGAGILGLAGAGGVAISGSYITGGVTQTYGSLGVSTAGVYYSGGLAGTGSKSFVEPHPTDATRMIQYYCLEGGESGTYFRGSARTAGKVATIEVPESFRLVTDAEGMTVQLTPTGADFALLRVERKGLDRIVVQASTETEFDYIVHGVRRAYKDLQSIVPNTFLRPESASATLPASLSKEEQQRLIANGTYNPDGTVNLETAERAGWAQIWREQEQARAATAAATPKPARP